MDIESIAARTEAVVQNGLDGYKNVEVVKFTPSVASGRRYVGIKNEATGQQFMVEINVTEV